MFTLSGLISANGPNVKNVIKNVVSKVVGFSHGINVVLLCGEYKGYYGTVNNFYPASYEIFGEGNGYVEAEKFGPIRGINSSLVTNYGPSIIEKYIKRSTYNRCPEIIIYRENAELKVGVFVNEMEILPLKLSELNLDDEFSNLDLGGRGLLKRLVFELSTNDELLYRLEHTRQFSDDYLMINAKDILSKDYLDINSGIFSPYNPSKDVYYISYTSVLQLNAGMVEIQNDKSFVIVKKGPLANGKLYKIKGYNAAKLSITLGFNGKLISNHIKNGKLSVISVNDVFYMDILLKNGETVEIVKTFINEIEVIDRNKKKLMINNDEIARLLPGTKLKTEKLKEVFEEVHEIIESEQSDEQLAEKNQEQEEMDYETLEHDYGNGDVVDVEGEQQISFKDTQRSSIEYKALTNEQTLIKSYIDKICQLLYINVDDNIYVLIDTVLEVVNFISNLSRNFGYNSYEVKYITLLVILYETKSYNTRFLVRLFPKYFTKKEVLNLNQNIFLKSNWYPKFGEQIEKSIKQVRELSLNKNSISSSFCIFLEIVLFNCDMILQDILGININLQNMPQSRVLNLIPLGMNKVTGKRVRDEENEMSLNKIKKVISSYLSINNILDGNILPSIEVNIQWGNENLLIIESFKQSLQNKFDIQKNPGYLYIKDNLLRAPFALMNDVMSEKVKKNFASVYKLLLNAIQNKRNDILLENEKSNLESIKVKKNRIEIYSNKPHNDFDDDFTEVKNTPSYIREQKKRLLENSINKASKNIYKFGPA